MNRIGRYLCLLPILLLALPDQAIGQDQEISALTAKIKRAKNSLSKIENKIDTVREKAAVSGKQAERAKQVQNSINALLVTKSEGQTKADALEAELIQNYKLLQAYQSNYRYTTDLSKGDALGDLTLKDGSKYSGTKFSGASSIGIQVIHSGGVANVPYDQLPTEVAAKFRTPPSTKTTINIPALLANKPSFNSDDDAGDHAEVDNSPAAKRKRRIAEATKQREASDLKKAKIDTALRSLYKEIDAVTAALVTQGGRKNQIIRELQMSKTKKSQADIDRLTSGYDVKISALRAQKSELSRKIDDLRKQK